MEGLKGLFHRVVECCMGFVFFFLCERGVPVADATGGMTQALLGPVKLQHHNHARSLKVSKRLVFARSGCHTACRDSRASS